MKSKVFEVPSDEGQVVSVAKEHVGARVRKGLKWSVLQVILRNVLSLVATALLARMLSPNDFGLIGMVATLTALLQVFSDMGLSWATIQRKGLSKIQVSNLFWINTCVGLSFWGGCIIASTQIGLFYGEEALVAITITLGGGFLLSGIAAQPMALLSRGMNYKTIAQIEILSITTGILVALVVAYLGLGYWALVIQSLVSSSIRAVFALVLSGITILAPRSGVGTISLVSFGGVLALNGFFIYIARNLDSVLIGKYWGGEQLGYYNRAYFLMLLPSTLATGVLTNLMVPSLSIFQNDLDKFGRSYRKALQMIALVGCPISLGLALTATEMVTIIYGEKWIPVVPMLMWLSLAGITQPIFTTTGWLFVSAGKTKEYLWLTICSGFLLVISFFFALPGGAIGIAKIYGLVMGVIIVFPALWFSHKVVGLDIKSSVEKLAPIFFCLVILFITVKLTEFYADHVGLGWVLVLFLKIIVGVFSYVFSCFLLRDKMDISLFK